MKNYIDDKEFINECNKKIAPLGGQLNYLLTHPTCTKDQCYCGKIPCYYSPLWENEETRS